MKKTLIHIVLLLVILSLNQGCKELGDKFAKLKSKSYFALFKEKPVIISQDIIYKQYTIGKVLGDELSSDGKFVKVKIKIHGKYTKLITSNAALFLDNSVIYLYLMDMEGKQISRGSSISGFNSKTAMNFAFAKYKMEQFAVDFSEWVRETVSD